MEELDLLGLVKAAQMLERNANVALMYSGLRIPQYRLLDLLARCGQATVSEMGAALHITRATASVMINELIRSGSLVTDEHPSDRRSFHIRLTDHGLQRMQSARSDLAVLIRKTSQRYPQEVVRVLNAFVQAALERPS